MLVIERDALPELVSVMLCAPLVVLIVWFPKARLVGESETAGAAAAVPVPLRATDCGLPGALSEIVNVPGWLPVAVGAKLTLIVQLPPAMTEVPQLSVSAYCELGVMLVMLMVVLPILLRVTD
jgi:hypothetical protein